MLFFPLLVQVSRWRCSLEKLSALHKFWRYSLAFWVLPLNESQPFVPLSNMFFHSTQHTLQLSNDTFLSTLVRRPRFLFWSPTIRRLLVFFWFALFVHLPFVYLYIKCLLTFSTVSAKGQKSPRFVDSWLTGSKATYIHCPWEHHLQHVYSCNTEQQGTHPRASEKTCEQKLWSIKYNTHAQLDSHVPNLNSESTDRYKTHPCFKICWH